VSGRKSPEAAAGAAAGRPAAGVRGSGTVGSLVALFFGGGIVLVVAALFMTGVAQRELIPGVRLRVERALARDDAGSAASDEAAATASGEAGSEAAGTAGDGTAAGDSALGLAGGSEAERLAALESQLATQRAFLEEKERVLSRLRSEIDSLVNPGSELDAQEARRQARLLAAMRPEEAARVLAAMDDDALAALLAQMNPRAASKVMAKLDAARIARISARALGRGELSGLVRPAGEATAAVEAPVR